MGSSTRYLHQLPSSMRAAILANMAHHPPDRPVYVASVIHMLGVRGLTVSRSNLVLKNAIAEAAISHGLMVGFGRPPVGPGVNVHHPIRRALVQLRRLHH